MYPLNQVQNIQITPEAISELRAHFQGRLLTAVDEGYDEARGVWNGMIDHRPALITRVQDKTDIQLALSFARQHNLPVSVRGGGHNVAGSAIGEGAIVIDCRDLRSIQVDPVHRIARAEPGVTWGELDRATQHHGLVTPGGLVSDTGIAGLTLSGGIGFLRSKFGLSCDNLVAVELVTGDGAFRRASATENPDLFWALRGGGGNFGVVTAFEYQLHPLGPEVMACFVFYPAAKAHDLMPRILSISDSLGDEFTPLLVFGRIPHSPAFPQQIHGEAYLLIAGVYVGTAEIGEQALAPLRSLGDVLVDFSGIAAYTEVQTMFDDDYPAGLNYYWRSMNLDTVSDPVITKILAWLECMPSHHSTIDIWVHSGAMMRTAPDATAYGDRKTRFLLNPEANWEDAQDSARNIEWVRGCIEDMQAFSDGGMYLNFPGMVEEGQKLLSKVYGAYYPRLLELKRRYDPDNLFRLRHNLQA